MQQPTVYFIRHGETEWNAAGRFQGTQDIPLNELGVKQAAQAGGLLDDLFARHGHTGPGLGFVASPLGRARHTMELVRGALRLAPGDYALDHRLREIAYGHWEGSTLAQQQASHPELFAVRERDKWGVPPPGGESYAAVTERMREWYRSLQGDTVAVAHGGTARALMVALDIETPERALEQVIEQGAVYLFRNGALAKYR
jgi:broad specificity phosphatase PhoE